MAYRDFVEVTDAAGVKRKVRPVDAREIEDIARGGSGEEAPPAASEEGQEGQQSEGAEASSGNSVSELVSENTREQLNSMAAQLGLEPSDYRTKDDIAKAIVEIADTDG